MCGVLCSVAVVSLCVLLCVPLLWLVRVGGLGFFVFRFCGWCARGKCCRLCGVDGAVVDGGGIDVVFVVAVVVAVFGVVVLVVAIVVVCGCGVCGGGGCY